MNRSFINATLGCVLVFALPGCVARTLVNVATTPVRVAGKAIDLATTSKSEADEKRGRTLRERERELGRLDRRRSQASRECRGGDRNACEDAQAMDDEITVLLRD